MSQLDGINQNRLKRLELKSAARAKRRRLKRHHNIVTAEMTELSHAAESDLTARNRDFRYGKKGGFLNRQVHNTTIKM